MKIIITNTVVLNTGDAAILFGVLEILRTAFGEDIEFLVYDSHPEVAVRYYPELIFRKWLYLNLAQVPRIRYLEHLLNFLNLNRLYFAAWCWSHNLYFIAKLILTQEELQDLSEYDSADIIISTGGTYLVENYPLKPRLFDYRISLLLQRHLVFFTQSLGPFSIPQYQDAFKAIFEDSLLILLRDRKSENNILNLGTNTVNTYVTADAAFALADISAVEAAQTVERFSDPLNVAISVREWKHFKKIDPARGQENYLGAVEAATIHLVEKYGAVITYISTCQGIPEYWTDDSKVALEVINKLPATISGSVTLDQNFHSPKELATLLGSYDLVISTRLHMAILALGAGVPVLPIAYEFKTQELFRNLGQEQWVLDIEEICAKSLISSLDSFINTVNKIRRPLFTAVKQERERALDSGQLVRKFFMQKQL